MIGAQSITGLVLAGGLGRRMAADGRRHDKALTTLRGRPLIDHVIDRLRHQVSTILINANDDPSRFDPRPWPVLADRIPGYAGPLAGLHAGLLHTNTPWLLTVPCDSPFLPHDLAPRLAAALTEDPGLQVVVARCDGRDQPVFALVDSGLAGDLETYLDQGGRKIDRWYGRLRHAAVDFPDAGAFVNLNSREDIAAHGGP